MCGFIELNYNFVFWSSGQVRVGVINFDMYLNVTYKELEPHIDELAELIATELEVDSHQVKLTCISVPWCLEKINPGSLHLNQYHKNKLLKNMDHGISQLLFPLLNFSYSTHLS